MSKHEIVHIEFSANDPKSAGNFYKDLFDWKLKYTEEMDYMEFVTANELGGGFPKVGETTQAGSTVVYVSTDDIDASLAKAASLGGSIMMPKTEIPHTGWFGLFKDPTGNVVGVYTPLTE